MSKAKKRKRTKRKADQQRRPGVGPAGGGVSSARRTMAEYTISGRSVEDQEKRRAQRRRIRQDLSDLQEVAISDLLAHAPGAGRSVAPPPEVKPPKGEGVTAGQDGMPATEESVQADADDRGDAQASPPMEGERSPPMTKAEFAQRVLQDVSARSRQIETVLKRCEPRPFTPRKWTFRLDRLEAWERKNFARGLPAGPP